MFRSLLYALKRPFHFVKTGLFNGLPAQIKYGWPARKLVIFGITGTDGKTTSSTLLYHVLKTAGKKVGLVSTVAAYLGEDQIDTGFHVTTPSPAQLQALMRRMVKEGYEYLVLETTSHGLYQYRTWGVTPTLAGVTNIDNEHLDYHLNYDNYVEAKALLLKQAKVAVINADDRSYGKLKRILKNTRTQVIEYSSHTPLPTVINKAVKARFPEKYNHMNARLVTALAHQVGVTNQDIANGMSTFPGIPGRMESIPNDRKLNIVVDFAHTPQGIEAALTALRQKMSSQKKKGRLISVNGCAGLRDTTKRPVMGAIAAELADLAVFTAEDPRVENVWSIIDQMKQNLGTHHDKVVSIADRKAAIAFALQAARPGDTVVVLGKGHEQSMCYGTTEYPWSDQQAIRDILPTLSA